MKSIIGRITLPVVRLRTVKIRIGRGKDMEGNYDDLWSDVDNIILDNGGNLLLNDGGVLLLNN